jgi:hypothetical protein
MEIKDNISLIISSLSAVIAFVSILIASATARRQKYTQSWLANQELINRSYDLLLKDPSLLRLFGVDAEELKSDGITPMELIFINTSMDAGHAWHRLSGERKVGLSKYRKNFLRDEKVRIAWKKYLRTKLFNETPWTKAIDKYIEDFENSQEKNI